MWLFVFGFFGFGFFHLCTQVFIFVNLWVSCGGMLQATSTSAWLGLLGLLVMGFLGTGFGFWDVQLDVAVGPIEWSGCLCAEGWGV